MRSWSATSTGRELYVGLLGNDRVRVFPVWEMHFEKMIEGGSWPIATERVKWSTKYQERYGIMTDQAQQPARRGRRTDPAHREAGLPDARP